MSLSLSSEQKRLQKINEKYTDGKELPEDITKSFQEEVQELLEQEIDVDIPKLRYLFDWILRSQLKP